MIDYNSNKNAYCRAVNAEAFLHALVGEVKVLIQNFLFHRVLHVGEG